MIQLAGGEARRAACFLAFQFQRHAWAERATTAPLLPAVILGIGLPLASEARPGRAEDQGTGREEGASVIGYIRRVCLLHDIPVV